jgi:hypothetical protein
VRAENYNHGEIIMKAKNGKPKCSLTGKTLTVETTGVEKKFNVSIRSGELIIGVGEFPSPTTIGGKLQINDIHTKIEWDETVPAPGTYRLVVIGVDGNDKGSAESEPLSIKLKTADINEIRDTIETQKSEKTGLLQPPVAAPTMSPATAPAEIPAVTGPVKPPVTPVPSVPVATDAPAEAKSVLVSKKATKLLMEAIKARLKWITSTLEGNPEIMNMGMDRGLKHEHEETCQLEFNEITRWASSLNLNDGGIEQTLQDILDRAGRLKAAVWILKCRVEEERGQQAARRVAPKLAQTQPSIATPTVAEPKPTAPIPPQPVIQPETVVPKPVPAAPASPVIPQRPATVPENVPSLVIPPAPAPTPAPVIPQAPTVTPVPAATPPIIILPSPVQQSEKSTAMLFAFLAVVVFALGVVIYAMYRSSPWIGPGTNQSHSSDTERAALAEATMGMNNAHQALEAAADRENLAVALASMPKLMTNVVIVQQQESEPTVASYVQAEQQAPAQVEICQQPAVVQQQVVVPSYYDSSPDYYPYMTPVVSFNFGEGGRYRYYYGSARSTYGPRWNGSYRHESSGYFRSSGHLGGRNRGH